METNPPAPAQDDPLFGWVRRHPRLAGAAGVIALVAVVGACQPGPGRSAPVAPVAQAAAAPASTVRELPGPAAAPTDAPKVAAPKPDPTVAPAPTLAPSATAQAEPVGPTGGKCADYASQADAQAALRRDPVRAGRLDDDRDGIACESNRAPFDKAPVARPARS